MSYESKNPYKGNIIERYKQIKDEEQVLLHKEQDIEDQQNKLLEDEKERISKEFDAEGDELDSLVAESTKATFFGEYLVDGATLTCTKATLDDFVIKTIGEDPDRTILVKGNPDENDKRLRTTLNVSENPANVAGLKYATTKDTIKGMNVFPFRCNCSSDHYSVSERENILKDPNRNQEGVCKHLMRLSDEWENLPHEGNNYLMMSDIQPLSGVVGGVASIMDASCTEGITMTSVLFCKHGGVIYPENSGQMLKAPPTVSAKACATAGPKAGILSREEMLNNAEYIYIYLTKKGWSTEAICGLLGNITRESKMNPGAWEEYHIIKKKGYGLVQWTSASDFLINTGLTIESADQLVKTNPKEMMDIQLEFLLMTLQPYKKDTRWYESKAYKYYFDPYEPSPGTPREMTSEEYSHSTCPPRDLALVFHACYERSGDGPDELDERIDAAIKYYDYFTKGILAEDFPK